METVSLNKRDLYLFVPSENHRLVFFDATGNVRREKKEVEPGAPCAISGAGAFFRTDSIGVYWID
jgi:hypothetical protein